MRTLNKVIIIGNLTRDPEIRETSNGQKIVTFGVATNREWSTSDGDRKESTEFHEIVGWGGLAEFCADTLKTGKLVYIEGYLKTRSWEDEQTGDKRFKTEIVMQDMIMLNKRGEKISSASSSESSNSSSEQDSSLEEPADEDLF